MDEEAVFTAIETDPARVVSAVQPELDPDPSDVASDLEGFKSDVESFESDVQTMCSDLELSDALSNEFITCP